MTQTCSRCAAPFVKAGRRGATPLCKACASACTRCGRIKRTRHASLCRRCAGPKVGTGGRVDLTTRYVDDLEAQRFVAEHAHGASQGEVAEAMGLSRGLVTYIEAQAIKHMRARLPLVGIDAEAFALMLDSKPTHPLAGTWADDPAEVA